MLRDRDSAFAARVLHALSGSLFPSLVFGMLLGYKGAAASGYGPAASIGFGLLAVVVMTLALALLALGISELAGRATSAMAHPRGVPYRFNHSGAQALLAQGRVDDAVFAFQMAIDTHAGDPAPLLALARIHRDHLGQHDVALRYFRQARDLPATSAAETGVLLREMLSLALEHLDDPLRVAPDLARHAERFRGTDEAAWAERELAELKAGLRRRGG